MKSKCNLPWFVLENRRTEKKTVSIMQERRAIVMAVCFMALFGSLLGLSAAYCPVMFGILVTAGFIIGFLCMVRFIFEYVRGE